ncbi:MAG: XTP/dITP diphosphatase [Nitrospiraceae bacterium]|nr:MAG: XTP/dITP diphosphatase [Nitrospiraceae bacterium]
MDIVLATKNRKKIEELKKILALMGTASRIFTLDDFPSFADVVEDGDTFEANAVKKAVRIAGDTGITALADDSGLEVDALGGAPGVYSARYAGEGADDRANLEKLLREMEHVPEGQRGARFVCSIAMAGGGEVKTFTGFVEGEIGRNPRGENGFGYDPVFYPKGHDRTFAEMSDREKNAISHRAMALRELQKYLLEKRGYIRGF